MVPFLPEDLVEGTPKARTEALSLNVIDSYLGRHSVVGSVAFV